MDFKQSCQELNQTASKLEIDIKSTAVQSLRRFREEQGLTLSELSCITGFPNDTLDRLEVGRRGVSLYHICILALVLDKTVKIVIE